MSRQRVLNILRGPEADRIRFTFVANKATITIARSTFDRVARAIERGKVDVTINNTLGQGIARYLQPNNIETHSVIGRLAEGAVLHESLHAYFDLARTDISPLDEETAGFVIDALYFRMTGLSSARWHSRIERQAAVVADDLLAHYAAGISPIPAVNPIPWLILRGVIYTHPHYAKTVRSPGNYPHDG